MLKYTPKPIVITNKKGKKVETPAILSMVIYTDAWNDGPNGEERDLPVFSFNGITNEFEPVCPRVRRAYAFRHAVKYRKTKKQLLDEIVKKEGML